MYQVVNVLGAINETGKLASDMYDIGKKRYYSESHGQEIPISEMDFQYMVRAFIKQNEKIESLNKQFEKLTSPIGMGGLIKCIFISREKIDSTVFKL